MKTTLMITALMIALAAANTCKGEAKTTHVVQIEHWRDANGYIVVREANRIKLARIKVADWAYMLGRPMPRIGNDLRHLALNAVAAVVAGHGEREHTVQPDAHISTIEESKVPSTQNLYPVVTIEHRMGFAIVRDTYTKSGYRAEIIAFPVNKSQLQEQPPHQDKSTQQEGRAA
jgi:hypothetical protein